MMKHKKHWLTLEEWTWQDAQESIEWTEQKETKTEAVLDYILTPVLLFFLFIILVLIFFIVAPITTIYGWIAGKHK